MHFRELGTGTEQTWEEKASPSIKHSSHLRGDKRELALETKGVAMTQEHRFEWPQFHVSMW